MIDVDIDVLAAGAAVVEGHSLESRRYNASIMLESVREDESATGASSFTNFGIDVLDVVVAVVGVAVDCARNGDDDNCSVGCCIRNLQYKFLCLPSD